MNRLYLLEPYHSDPNAAVKLGPGEAQIWPKNVDCLSLGSEWEKLISTVESPSCVALGPFFSTETSKVPRGPSDEWANETKQKKNMQDRPIPRCWLINDSRLNRRIESLYYFLCSWSSSLVGQQRAEIASAMGENRSREDGERDAKYQFACHSEAEFGTKGAQFLSWWISSVWRPFLHFYWIVWESFDSCLLGCD